MAFLVLAVVALASIPAAAIENLVIDTFNAEPEEPIEPGGGGTVFDRDILGGSLDILLSEDATCEVGGDYFIIDGSGVDSGQSAAQLSWDGEDEDPFTVTFDGLGGVNLTEDDLGNEQDALSLRLNSVSTSGTITVVIYTEEFVGSQFSFSPQVSGVPTDVVIPFSSFTIMDGMDDPAEFNNVGAIVFQLGGGLVAELDQLEITTALSSATKTDALQTDVNSNTLVDPGDTLRYTVSFPVSAAVAAVFTDPPDDNSALVVGSVTTTHGSVTTGNSTGDSSVEVDLGTLVVGSPVTITFDVVVNDPFPDGTTEVCNQGMVSGTGLASVMTDDPDVSVDDPDPTCTGIFVDMTDPEFTFVPADISVNSGDDTSPPNTGGYATATDDVTADPEITYTDAEISGPGLFQRRIERTWTATDEAGNSISQMQTITIVDTASRLLSVDQPVYGLFQPSSDAGHRQLGTIELDGTIGLLGTATSIDSGAISTSSGVTAYNMGDDVVYFIGETDADGVSRVFSVDVSDGSATSQPLSSGTAGTVVGIWYDDANAKLFGLFHAGVGDLDRQLAEIDPATGTVAFLAQSISAPISTVGGIVAGDSSDGEFYFLGSAAGLPGSIYTADTTTGAVTSATLSGANYNAIASLEFDPFGEILYALIFESGERRLATIDPDTGTVATIGSTTVGGGGVQIATYTGVSALDPISHQFLFVGRYDDGSGNVWALFAVDTVSGDTTYNNIETTLIDSGNYYGLQYALSAGELEVVKNLVPIADPGLFDLTIDGNTAGTGVDVGNNGTTGTIAVNAGSYEVGESAGTGTDLVDYNTIIECRDEGGSGSVVASGTNPLSVTVAEGDHIVCVITNTRDTTKPSVTIDQAGTQADPTNTSPVVFTAVFDEPINDTTFTDLDVTVGGTATTGAVTITEIAPMDGTTFSVSVVVTGDGTVQPTIPADGVEDPAGNTNNASTSTDNTVTYDTAEADVTINQAGAQADPTNTSPVVFTAVFDEPINDTTFTNADVSVGGTATTGAVTVTEIAPNDDTTFEVSIGVTADGTVTPTIPAGGVEDPAGNTNTASTSTDNAVTVETVKPDVTIDQAGAQADPTNTSPVVFTAVFDEPINDTTFTNADVTVGGTAATGAVTVSEIAPMDGTTFSVSVVVTGDGTVQPTIPADGVEDPAGNTNTASTSTDNSVTYDTTKPDVTINQAGAQADPTNTSPVVFTAVFDEPINDTTFTNADVSVGGTATTGAVTITEVAPNDDTTFEVSIVVTADGTVQPTIPAGGVEDPAGNTNTVSTSTDNSVTVETVKPDVTINQVGAQADPTNASPVVFTAVFNEPINDATFTNADVNVGGTATTGTVTVTEVAPNDDTTFEVSIVVTADGTVVPTIPAGGVEDPAGNTNTVSTSTDNSVTVETVKPDVTINQKAGQADPTDTSPVVFTAVFDEPINDATFTNVDVDVGGTATTGTVTITEVAPNDDTTFEVSIVVTADGTVQPTIPAGGVEDPVGNTNTVSTSTDHTVTYDTTKPDVTINQKAGQADPTDTSPVVFTAVFDEPINDATFTNADVNVGGTATTGTVTVTEIAPNDDTTFEVSIDVTADGTVQPTIPAGGVVDPAGNTNTVSTSTDNSVTVETVKPDVTINQSGGQADPTNASPVVFTAVFDEPINDTTFTNADVNVGGTATTGTVTVTEVAPNDDTTFEVSIVVTADGTVVPTIPAGGVEDPAGNTNTVSTSTDNSVTLETVKPDVTINQAGVQADPTNASPVVFTAVFNEPINDTTFTNLDVTVGGTATTGTVTVTEIAPNDDTAFEVSIVVTADGTVQPTIPAGGVEDPAGNTNTASTSTDNSVTVETVKPDVTINQAGTQVDPTNGSPINFTVVFNEAVTGFENGDVTLGGAANPTTGTVTESTPNDGTTYNVAVSGMTANGTVTATIEADVAQDAASNANTASTSTDNEVTYNGLPEVATVSVMGETRDSATVNGTITYLGVPDPTAHGVVWNLAGGADPTLADNSTDEGATGTIGAFTTNMTGLDPNTDYAVRAYATNAEGTAYGNVLTFTTLPSAMPPIYYLLDEPEPEPTRRR